MSWVSYMKAQLVKAEIDEDRESNLCRVTEAQTLIKQWGADSKGDRVTIAKAKRDVTPEVVDQQERYRVARAYRKLVEAMFESCERSSQLLSRELSRRIGLHSKEQRTQRFGA
jgi:proline dehydrogenase